MDNPGEILLLCRLCLVKDQVNIPIFEEQGDIRQIFLKISSCLPIKVSRDDQLPKKICDGCSNKLDLLYEFWNTSANAEKTLLSWLGQAGVKDADETINAVAQQIAKPAETQVKEETETLEDGHVNSQNQDNFEPQSFDEGTKDEDEAPPPKRARRSAAVKAQINITPESDDDDDLDSAEPMTKMEGESDESDGEEKDPSYAEVPGTSADDQAGPSGVGKDGAEAPEEIIKIELIPDSSDVSDEEKPAIDDKLISVKLEKDEKKFGGNFSSEDELQNESPLYILLTPEGYKCPHCILRFMSIESLKSHLSLHKSENNIRCTICYEEFKTKSDLTAHLKRVHCVKRKYPCNVCGIVFENEDDLKDHSNGHLTGSVKCQICNETFRDDHDLALHLPVHLKNREPPHECFICGKKYSNRSLFKKHLYEVHCKETATGKLACTVCGRQYSSLNLCLLHYKEHVPAMLHYCEHCGQGFVKQCFLRLHIEGKHSGLRKICEICGVTLQDKKSLAGHMRRHGPKYKRPPSGKCEICSKFYRNINRHVQEAHKSILQCQFCGKVFQSERGLEFHLKLHKNEKPFECEFCGKRFILNSVLQTHLRTHPESGVEPYECEHCGKKFNKKCIYESHVNIHLGKKPFECDFCGKKFSVKNTLRAHKRANHSQKIKSE